MLSVPNQCVPDGGCSGSAKLTWSNGNGARNGARIGQHAATHDDDQAGHRERVAQEAAQHPPAHPRRGNGHRNVQSGRFDRHSAVPPTRIRGIDHRVEQVHERLMTM